MDPMGFDMQKIDEDQHIGETCFGSAKGVGLRSHYVASYYAAPLLLKSAANSSEFRPLLLGL